MTIAGSGCFAFDELDKGNAILEAHTPASKKKKPAPVVEEEPSGPGAGESVGKWFTESRKDVSEWWRQALEEEPVAPDPDDGIGRCEIRGSISFKRRSDCELRGGRFTEMKKQAAPAKSASAS